MATSTGRCGRHASLAWWLSTPFQLLSTAVLSTAVGASNYNKHLDGRFHWSLWLRTAPIPWSDGSVCKIKRLWKVRASQNRGQTQQKFQLLELSFTFWIPQHLVQSWLLHQICEGCSHRNLLECLRCFFLGFAVFSLPSCWALLKDSNRASSTRSPKSMYLPFWIALPTCGGIGRSVGFWKGFTILSEAPKSRLVMTWLPLVTVTTVPAVALTTASNPSTVGLGSSQATMEGNALTTSQCWGVASESRNEKYMAGLVIDARRWQHHYMCITCIRAEQHDPCVETGADRRVP